MSRLCTLLALLLCPTLIFAQPAAAPEAPADAPTDGEVVITGDEADDASDTKPDQPAGPMVDSKVCQSWMKFGTGTTVETKSTITAPAGENGAAEEFNIVSVSTLKEKAADSVTIETSFTDTPGGQPMPPEVNKQNAKVPEGMEYAPTGFTGKLTQVGSEPVTLEGKTFECKILEFDGLSDDGMPMKGRVWVSDEVPGTHVKGTF